MAVFISFAAGTSKGSSIQRAALTALLALACSTQTDEPATPWGPHSRTHICSRTHVVPCTCFVCSHSADLRLEDQKGYRTTSRAASIPIRWLTRLHQRLTSAGLCPKAAVTPSVLYTNAQEPKIPYYYYYRKLQYPESKIVHRTFCLDCTRSLPRCPYSVQLTRRSRSAFS
ncbi:hypothetical protein BGX38DRAFT_194634 [Terfezia claveryi]|nr:hypothetical protein BGX38DRAFT_194634 [Terfezia claveryi]